MKTFSLSILVPNKTIMQTEALSAQFPGANGYFGVLSGHAPLFAMLKEGVITVKTTDKILKITVKEGFAAIANNKVTVLVDSAVVNN